MPTTVHARQTSFFTRLFSVFHKPKAERMGPMPQWLNDRDLSSQLLKDTGLSREELGLPSSYDAKKPFFMQRNYW